MVCDKASQYRCQPSAYFVDWLVHGPSEDVGYLANLLPQTLGNRHSFEEESSFTIECADVREAEKAECLRLALAPLLAVMYGLPAKLNQTGLARVERQAKRRETVSEGGMKSSRYIPFSAICELAA